MFLPAFTFVDIFPLNLNVGEQLHYPLNLNGREQLNYLSIRSREIIPRPILEAQISFMNHRHYWDFYYPKHSK